MILNTIEYPSVPERFKAVLVDTLMIIILMIIITSIFDRFEHVPDMARLAALVIVFGLYDPILTSFFGGTVGHRALGLRVKKSSNTARNINFPMAIIRFFCKSLLGGISLLTVTGTEKKKAIHDMVSGSIVIYQPKP